MLKKYKRSRVSNIPRVVLSKWAFIPKFSKGILEPNRPVAPSNPKYRATQIKTATIKATIWLDESVDENIPMAT